jgi:hypothetical protein
MGVRESINGNTKLGVGVGTAILVLALATISYQLFGGGGTGVQVSTSAFYTDDNGKTFFKDNAYKVSPFDHNGKKAFRADVYQCPDGKQFVAFLYRHNALGRKAMEEHLAKGAKDPQGTFLAGLEFQGMEVKPAGAGDNAWRSNSGSGERSVKCPSGGPAQPVNP